MIEDRMFFHLFFADTYTLFILGKDRIGHGLQYQTNFYRFFMFLTT